VYRGWSTNPFYLSEINGYAFGETTLHYFFSGTTANLPSAGAGVKLYADILRLPVILAGEYAYGFDVPSGGGSQFTFIFYLGNFLF